MKDYKAGDLQVWWVPQIPMEEFVVDVNSVEEGAKILDVLAHYDLFQLKHHVKGDYSNVGGLRRWCLDDGEGMPGWEDWYDEETFEDDPQEFILKKLRENESNILEASKSLYYKNEYTLF